MYQNLSTTSEAEMAFRQAIDNVGDAGQREWLRQAYIHVETQARAHDQYSFARHGAGYFLSIAVKLGYTALVKFFLTEYHWEQWFRLSPKFDGILLDVIAGGNSELLNWLLKESPVKVRDRCWENTAFYFMVKVALECAQLDVIRYFCEAYKKEWQKCYTSYGDNWLITAAQMRQVKIVRFLLTRDDVEQMMSKMKFWFYFDPKNEVESEVFANIIETIAQACLEIKSEKLFNLFIEKIQDYIATKQPKLQASVQQVQERFAATIALSKLQHQRIGIADTAAEKQKHQGEQLNKCVQLKQKIVQQAPAAGLVDVFSDAIEAEVATHNSAENDTTNGMG